MLTELGRAELSRQLNRVFGKDTFTLEEITKEFYTDLYIGCSDFFKTQEGFVDLDFFWSDDVRDFLLRKVESE